MGKIKLIVTDLDGTSTGEGGTILEENLKAVKAAQEIRMESSEMIAIDVNTMPWEERFKEEHRQTTFRKLLLQDPDTGMEVRLVRYPAGVVIPWHTHPCAHGMYILEGTLTTHAGNYGPGSFVWFPEGMAMSHGASTESDVTMLFINNKPMGIDYLSAPQP